VTNGVGINGTKGRNLSTVVTDTPIKDLIGDMTAASIEASTLNAPTLALVRIAALVAVDAPPASYLLNLGAAREIGIGANDVKAVVAAVAPIVGTPRVVSAAGNIARALGFAMELEQLEEEAE
jgi:4-carboxymuconolactone decarboxylase